MTRTVTLYLNSQTGSDRPENIFHRQWRLAPYKEDTVFDRGETHEQAEFVLPPNCYLIEKKGVKQIVRGMDSLCKLLTGERERPFLAPEGVEENTGICLYRQGEKPPRAEIKQAARRPAGFVPSMVDGEWEIY